MGAWGPTDGGVRRHGGRPLGERRNCRKCGDLFAYVPRPGFNGVGGAKYCAATECQYFQDWAGDRLRGGGSTYGKCYRRTSAPGCHRRAYRKTKIPEMRGSIFLCSTPWVRGDWRRSASTRKKAYLFRMGLCAPGGDGRPDSKRRHCEREIFGFMEAST